MQEIKTWLWPAVAGAGIGLLAAWLAHAAGISFVVSPPVAGIVLALIGGLAALISFWMYRTAPELMSRTMAVGLALFRFCVLFAAAALLLEPQMELSNKEVSPPLAAIVVDQSESVLIQKDSLWMRTEFPRELQQFRDKLEAGGARVEVYGFGNRLLPDLSPDSLRFTEAGTNISGALDQIRKMYAGQNLAAVTLISDGIATSGENPLYAVDAYKQPVYPVLLGDTTVRKDLWIAEVLHNEIAYLGNDAPMRVKLKSQGYEGQTVQVSLSIGGKVLATQNVSLSRAQPDPDVDFLIRPERTGIVQYNLAVTALPGELTLRNNARAVFINVLETKVRVALLAGYPHPDVGALHQALETDPRYAVTDFVHSGPGTWYRDPLAESFAGYDLVILHNFPFNPGDARVAGLIATEVKNRSLPLMIFAGQSTHLPTLQASLGEYMALNAPQPRMAAEEAQLDFKPEYAQHSTFTFGEDWLPLMSNAPPFYRNTSEWRPRGDAKVLATARIRNVSVDYPVFALQEHLGRKNMMFTGENFWRFRTHVFQETQSFEAFDAWLGNLIQWLMVKDDKRKFKVKPSKPLFTGSETAILRGEAYDESYKPLGGVEVKLNLRDPAGREEVLYLKETAPGQYFLELNNLAEGAYSYTAAGTKNGVQVGTDKGEFSVGKSDVEHFRLQADRTLMDQLAVRTQGKLFEPRGLSQLADEILKQQTFKPTSKIITRRTGMHEYIWICILLIGLLALEWVIRKWHSLP